MNRKQFILLLLKLSWPIGIIRKFFQGSQELHYFLFPELWDTKSWYSYHIFHKISYACVFLALWLYMNSNMRKDKDVIAMFGGIFVIQLLDLPNYLLFRQQSRYFVLVQFLILLFCSLKSPIEKWKNRQDKHHSHRL